MTTIRRSHLRTIGRNPREAFCEAQLLVVNRRWGARFVRRSAMLCLLLLADCFAHGQQPSRETHSRTAAIPAAEFSRLVQEFSEGGGSFFSDNFTSNEISYLHIADRLRERGISGGAYLGVGPEQNFTYIAKIRPQIAFIVDIRRQAVLQHLLYKAIFQKAKNRAQFLSLLFSRPLTGAALSGKIPSLEVLLESVNQASTSEVIFKTNLATMRETIEREFQFPLSPDDLHSLEYVYRAFWRANLDISFRFGGMRWGGGFPRLRDLILATDLSGKLGNFLAREQDYEFVRKLELKNRVIPVVGDFGGAKALASVAAYLQRHGYTVSAFYTSNVEQYLFADEMFGAFVENVRKLPVTRQSVIIRSARANWIPNTPQISGYRMTTVMGNISVFLQDYDAGLYSDYWSLVTTHYIPPGDVPTDAVTPVPVP